MPATDEERLVVSLEARIRDFERNMQKAERTGSGSFNRLRQGSRGATQAMESDMIRSTQRINQALAQTSTRIGSFGKALIGGLALGAGIGALEGFRQAAVESTKSILELADGAKVAGVSFKAFQQLKFVAEQNRVGVDALTDGLKEMSLRADEFVLTGAGSGAEAFQRLGFSAEDLARRLKAPDQLFITIIGRLRQLDKAAQIRISDEVFGGTGGEQFVQLINQGEAGIRAQIKAAQDLGLVMDDSMIAKAEEVDRAFKVITTTIGTHLKSAIVNAVSAWSTFLDSYREFQDQQKGTLELRQSQLGLKRIDLENQLIQIPKSEEITRRKIGAQLDEIATEEAIIVNELNQRLKRTKDALPPEVVLPSSGAPVPSSSSSRSGSSSIDLVKFLAAGKSAEHISGMSSGFEAKLEKMFAALPKELAGAISINSGYRSVERQQQLWQEALAKYGSVAEARKWVAPPGNSQHNRGNAADLGYSNDAARKWAHENAGQFGLSFPLSNENWHIEDSDARAGAMQERTQQLEQAGQAYDDLLSRGREFVAQQGIEGQALGMTEQAAARLRYEQELLDGARQAGMNLTPQQTESIRQLATEMASAEEQTRRLTQSQEEARASAAQWAGVAQGATKGFITDLMNGATASDALRSALSKIADVLLDQVLTAMFQVGGTMGGGGGGLFGSSNGGLLGNLIGSLFSFDGGGHTGNGSRSGGVDGKGGFPAILHPQETVVDHTKERSGSRQSSAASSSSVDVEASVVVRMENDGTLSAFVERTSAKAADKRVRQYDAALPGRVGAIKRNPRKRMNQAS